MRASPRELYSLAKRLDSKAIEEKSIIKSGFFELVIASGSTIRAISRQHQRVSTILLNPLFTEPI